MLSFDLRAEWCTVFAGPEEGMSDRTQKLDLKVKLSFNEKIQLLR
jgi:hypothetical protein